ncbi:MAG TPA: hypothetical protein VF570_14905 [Pyrinomonadaceae bacterium]
MAPTKGGLDASNYDTDKAAHTHYLRNYEEYFRPLLDRDVRPPELGVLEGRLAPVLARTTSSAASSPASTSTPRQLPAPLREPPQAGRPLRHRGPGHGLLELLARRRALPRAPPASAR